MTQGGKTIVRERRLPIAEGKNSGSLELVGVLLQHLIIFEKGDGMLEGNPARVLFSYASGREQ